LPAVYQPLRFHELQGLADCSRAHSKVSRQIVLIGDGSARRRP
jgi:hypothetical protein